MPRLSAFSVVEGDPDISVGRSDDGLAPEGINVALPVDQESSDPLQLFKDRSRSSPLLDALKIDSVGTPMETATDLAAAFRAPIGQTATPEQPPVPPIDPVSDSVSGELTVVAVTPDTLIEPVRQEADHKPVPTPSPPPAGTSGEAELRAELKRAFEDGLCAQLPAQSGEFGPEILRLIGALLRTSIVGTLDLMRARSVVKKEIRVEMTVIEPNDNNPLKFSPDADIAIQYLFGRKYPGFLGPTAAMAEAYSDLSSHQMGMVAGMRSAMEDIIHRFDPANIQTDVVAKGLMSKISWTRGRGDYWDAYCARYRGIADALGHDFQDFYAKAFTRAYEEEIGGLPEVNPPP
jgi:type VI secretion system FHA domain protein